MEKFKSIKQTNLSNSQHFEFMNSFKNLLESEGLHAIPTIAASYATFVNAFENEDRYFLVTQGSELTESLTNADKARDRIFTCLKTIVNAWAKNYVLPTEQSEALKVKKLLDRYKLNVDVQQDSETALIKNLIADLKTEAITNALTTIRAENLVSVLENQNKLFAEILAQRDAETARKPKGALRKTRLTVDKQYKNLLKIIEVFAHIGDNTEMFENFIITWNATIVHYEQILVRKENKENVET